MFSKALLRNSQTSRKIQLYHSVICSKIKGDFDVCVCVCGGGGGGGCVSVNLLVPF